MWRKIHLWISMGCALFLVLACLTGIILSFEPLYQSAHPYYFSETDKLLIADVLANVITRYEDIVSISRDPNGFVAIEALSTDESRFYIDPRTGIKLGGLFHTPTLFDFCRSLHRSLFMGSAGRLIMGLVSMLLLISCISGIYLTARKQGGFSKYFRRIVPHHFFQDSHTHVGRVLVIFILIVCVTAIYLSLERFGILPDVNLTHEVPIPTNAASEPTDLTSFSIFQDKRLSELREIVFPFSRDVEEYFELKLRNEELLIDQFSGEIVSTIHYPTTKKLANLSYDLHTGTGLRWWAFVLGLTSFGLLFLVCSGMVIYLKRAKKPVTNPFKKDLCSDIVLVGSEYGGTHHFASHFHKQLLKNNVRSYICDMNAFESFKRMERIWVFTSTYGIGEAPVSANRFLKLFDQCAERLPPFQYAVVGFGSSSYPDFCGYARQVERLFSKWPKATKRMDACFIDNQSAATYQSWVAGFNKQSTFSIDAPKNNTSKPGDDKEYQLTVINKLDSANKGNDHTFLLALETKKKICKNYQSGDLLVIKPNGEHKERFYSMSILGQVTVLLSIRVHEQGVVSSHLNGLGTGDHLTGRFQTNERFHFPDHANTVIMVGNGTGIGPFLGMIHNNRKKKNIVLYWGGQQVHSFSMFQGYLDTYLADKRLSRYATAFSRGVKKEYVQDVLLHDSNELSAAFRNQSTFMICGSLAMREGVYKVLKQVCEQSTDQSFENYKASGLILEDCY